jgi:hypothetical protein
MSFVVQRKDDDLLSVELPALARATHSTKSYLPKSSVLKNIPNKHHKKISSTEDCEILPEA